MIELNKFINGGIKLIVTVIGNDKRQSRLAHLLNKKYDTIYLSGNEDIKTAKNIVKISDVIIFPLPLTRDKKTINTTDYNCDEILSSINNNAHIFGGMCDNLNFSGKITDYNCDEFFTLKNALYTAESAVALAIMNTDFSLNNAEILILGNGRIGKYLSKILSSFCDNITVSARREKDFKYIQNHKLKSVNTNEISSLENYDVIFNTIPERSLLDTAINSISNNTLVIDLSSKNSGLKNSSRYIDAKALPCKYCEQSAAETLYHTINKHLSNK